jgi:hypothetical protein
MTAGKEKIIVLINVKDSQWEYQQLGKGVSILIVRPMLLVDEALSDLNGNGNSGPAWCNIIVPGR